MLNNVGDINKNKFGIAEEEFLNELVLLGTYFIEPKADIEKINKTFNLTLKILESCLRELQNVYKALDSGEIVLNEEYSDELIARFNSVTDKTESTFDNWYEMTKKVEEDVLDVYMINGDMHELHAQLVELVNFLVSTQIT